MLNCCSVLRTESANTQNWREDSHRYFFLRWQAKLPKHIVIRFFSQVSGISFAFDPKKPSGQRVEQKFVKVGDEYIERDRKYHMATKAYLVSQVT